MKYRPYGTGNLFCTVLIDGAGDPPGLTFAGPTLVAGDAKRFTDALPIGNLTAEFVAFTSGGTSTPAVGDTLTGATSSVTAVVVGAVVTSGSFAGGDAAGYLFLEQLSGALQAENLNNTTQSLTNVATIAGDSTPSIGAIAVGDVIWCGLTSTEMACKMGAILFEDQAATVWAADGIEFETTGNANAMHPDVIGNLDDAAAAGAVTTTDTLMAYVKQLVTGVNVSQLNGVTVAGAGTSGDKWRAA